MNIFNRNITVSVRTSDQENTLIVDGIFIDTHHELLLSMTVDIEKFKVLGAEGDLRRTPHTDCVYTREKIKHLEGIDLTREVRKQVLEAVGREAGCTHLVELALECVKGVLQAKFRLMRQTLPPEEVTRQITDYLQGTCYHYRTT